jgi:hypothetical protein
MSLQHVYGKRPRPLLWAGSRAVREKVTVSGIPNRHYNCVICMVECVRKVAVHL